MHVERETVQKEMVNLSGAVFFFQREKQMRILFFSSF